MRTLHTISGTPRSGSTLLCNVLNQNPRFHASSTSCVAQSLRALSNLWSNSSEIKSDLVTDQAAAEDRMVRASKAMIEAWYEDQEAEVIFDKGRLWGNQPLALHQVFPDAHMFICVRDLRDIFASVERQHAKNPMLDNAQNAGELTSLNRAKRMFSPEGLIGAPIVGVEDLGRRQLEFVHFIQYETLVQSPKLVLDQIYATLGEDAFAHDFKDVKNTATDADSLYLNKFPHEGSGEVKPPDGSWQDHVSPDIANEIMTSFPLYNRAFGYNNAGR
jgi:sulfotransferase